MTTILHPLVGRFTSRKKEVEVENLRRLQQSLVQSVTNAQGCPDSVLTDRLYTTGESRLFLILLSDYLGKRGLL